MELQHWNYCGHLREETHVLCAVITGLSISCDANQILPIAIQAYLLVLEEDPVLPLRVRFEQIDDSILVSQTITVSICHKLLEKDLHAG